MTTCSTVYSGPDLSDLRALPDFVGTWPRLTGRQTPEIELRQAGDESEGDRCAEYGRRIGLRCMPWEWLIVRAIMSVLAPNEWGERLWAHRNVVIECTRQQGKTLIIVLVILWRLFRRHERIVYTAQQWATVEDVFDRVVAVIMRVPSLRNRLAEKPSKKDNRGTIKVCEIVRDEQSGRDVRRVVAKADFGPRTQHYSRGFTEIDLLIIDEAYDVVPKHAANLTGAQAASNNPQTIYASTPPVIREHPNCHRFSGLVRLVEKGVAKGLYGALFRAPKGMKRDQPEAYRLAQPSYGVVGNDEEMQAYLQGAQSSADLALFDADWMGWGDYPPPEDEANRVFDMQEWGRSAAAPQGLAGKLFGPRTLTVERLADRQLWIIGSAQRADGGRPHVELGYVRSASSAKVVADLLELRDLIDPVSVLISSRSAAIELVSLLTDAGIETTVVNGVQEAGACGGFLDATVSHADQRLLNDAVSMAVKHELPGGSGRFVFDRDAEPSTPYLMAAVLAHYGLLMYGQLEEPAPEPAYDRSAAVEPAAAPWTGATTDFDVMSVPL